MTSYYEIAVAEVSVLINAAIMAIIVYGLYVLVSAAGFNPAVYAKFVAGLFVTANIAFFIAKMRKGAAWNVAKHYTEDQK